MESYRLLHLYTKFLDGSPIQLIFDHGVKRHSDLAGVEQAMKNWEGNKILQLPPLFQFAPIYWGHMPFLPSSLGRACCDHNESARIGLQLSVDIALTSGQIR